MLDAVEAKAVISFVDSTTAHLGCVPAPLLELLRYDLSYSASGSFAPSAENGYDGFTRLMTSTGYTWAGLVPTIRRLLDKYQYPHSVLDQRKRPDEELPLHSSGFSLRPYQDYLVNRALDLGRGVIDSPPRSGKTRMMGAVIDKNPQPSLIIAPTKGIVRQTVRALASLSTGPGGVVEVLEVTGGWPKSKKAMKEAEEALVVVTTAASASRAPQSFYDSRKLLAIDEFHHAAASTYHTINALARNVYYRYGFTGTHFRSDENTEILMDAVLSEVVGRVEVQQLIDGGWLTPADFVFLPIEGPPLSGRDVDLDQAYRVGILHHERRNQWAAWAAQQLMAMGKRVLVLVKLVPHGEKLASMIPGSLFVRGAGERDGVDLSDAEVDGAIRAFNQGTVRCLVGTSVLGEGIDLPAADALVYAKGGSAPVTVTQDVFRVLTANGAKQRAIVVDFADRHHPGLCAQSLSRGRVYASEDAFTVDVLASAADFPEWLRQHPERTALN